VPGGVAVDDVDRPARDDVRERARERTQAAEVERHVLQARLGGKAGEQRPGGASHQHAVTAPRQVQAQAEDGLGGAGALALVGELEDRERRRHVLKVAILSRPCTSWSY